MRLVDPIKKKEKEREERLIFLVKRGNGSSPVYLLTQLIERRIIFQALFAKLLTLNISTAMLSLSFSHYIGQDFL